MVMQPSGASGTARGRNGSIAQADMNDRVLNVDSLLDRAAIALSGLCLVHCLTLPLIVAGVPLLAQFGGNHLHAQVLIVVLPVSLFAFALGFRRHGNKAVVVSGLAGALLLLLGATFVHDNLGLAADRMTTVAASLMLAASHYVNNRLSRHARKS